MKSVVRRHNSTQTIAYIYLLFSAALIYIYVLPPQYRSAAHTIGYRTAQVITMEKSAGYTHARREGSRSANVPHLVLHLKTRVHILLDYGCTQYVAICCANSYKPWCYIRSTMDAHSTCSRLERSMTDRSIYTCIYRALARLCMYVFHPMVVLYSPCGLSLCESHSRLTIGASWFSTFY